MGKKRGSLFQVNFRRQPKRTLGRFPQSIENAALRNLDILNAAHKLGDLRSLPGNRLEALKGDLEGFNSIRVNDQWRITFHLNDGVQDVSSVDYH
jgi:proteic killer suppression protein